MFDNSNITFDNIANQQNREKREVTSSESQPHFHWGYLPQPYRLTILSKASLASCSSYSRSGAASSRALESDMISALTWIRMLCVVCGGGGMCGVCRGGGCVEVEVECVEVE